MTAGSSSKTNLSNRPRIGYVTFEKYGNNPEDEAKLIKINWQFVNQIFSDLKIGIDITSIKRLRSNSNLSSRGVQLIGGGFLLTKSELNNIEREVAYLYFNGRDIQQNPRDLFVIDLFDKSESDVKQNYPKVYQWIFDRVKPDRDQNNRKSYREKWWIFGEPRASLRPALKGLSRYIVTVETAKHRIFIFLNQDIIPDNMLIALALDDAYCLGILSSQIHVIWALELGGNLGGNTPRYNKTICFDPFPFPDPPEDLKQQIRELGERLDSHRKQVQANHPDVTITAMYNCLEKMRSGEPFTDKDREFNNKALITTLKQIHDDLDQAVFRAYGWDDLIPQWRQVYCDPPQPPLSKEGAEKVPLDKGDLGESNVKEQLEQNILQRLVDLNAQRAEEERNGHIRWLRPEYQAPDSMQTQKVIEGVDIETETETGAVEQQKFPTKIQEQLAAVRDLLRSQGGEWTAPQIGAQFKGATAKNLKAISQCLDILEDLGVILSHTETNGKRYFSAER